MAKNILQDVNPPNKRTIRNIPITLKDKKNDHNLTKPITVSEEPFVDNEKKISFKKWIWAVILLLLIIVFFTFSTFLSGAEVILVPKEENIDLATSFIANKGGENDSVFSVLTITEEGSKVTYNMEEKDVDKKASGEIIIFNDYGSSPERLVKNTRFETADGLIYRITKSVVVPGKNVASDGKVTPGSVTVTVYADAPGEKYNIGLVDFTIPGLKGTDRYSKFYARSKTPMTEGYSGIMKIVPDNELENLREEIRNDLSQKLKNKIYSQIPEGYILYDDGIFVDFEHVSNIDLGDSVQVVERGVLNAIVFDKLKLSDLVAKNTLPEIGDNTMEIFNLEDLKFDLLNKNDLDSSNVESFEFNLSGPAHFVWRFNEKEIASSFAGQPKKNMNYILSKFDGIKEAQVTLRPFWKMTFPGDLNKIKIERKFSLE